MLPKLPEPTPQEPDRAWKHYSVYKGVIDALYRLPTTFESPLEISVDHKIIMGIELKGWYVLAKEREPSFRYKATPAVCASADLLVIVPWALGGVISGSPVVFDPYIVPARFAAEYRNWWWRYRRETQADTRIELSKVTTPYPVKSDEISDRPASDSGGNFGRFARTGLMDDYIRALFAERLSGIPLGAWQSFFALFKEDVDLAQVERRIDRMAVEKIASGSADSRVVEEICSILGALIEGLRRDRQ